MCGMNSGKGTNRRLELWIGIQDPWKMAKRSTTVLYMAMFTASGVAGSGTVVSAHIQLKQNGSSLRTCMPCVRKKRARGLCNDIWLGTAR